MKVICIDVDGVLADFVLGFRVLANALYNAPIYTTKEQSKWAFEDLTRAQETSIWNKIKLSSTFWTTLIPLATTQELIKLQLLERLENLYFITNRPGYKAKHQTEEWLCTQGFKNPTVIQQPSGEKGEIVKALKATYMIDDKPENIENILMKSPTTRTYILTQLYNLTHRTDAIRINTLTEFISDLNAT